MRETFLYRLLLRLFPVVPYEQHAGTKHGGRFRVDIHDEGDGSLYLRRFVMRKAPERSHYLHHIVRSDRDRCLHDHPRTFLIFVLWGGYWEHLSEGVRWRGPGSVRRMAAETRHRVELRKRKNGSEIPAWTFCVVGPKIREWGFWAKDGWTPYREFLAGDREC